MVKTEYGSSAVPIWLKYNSTTVDEMHIMSSEIQEYHVVVNIRKPDALEKLTF